MAKPSKPKQDSYARFLARRGEAVSEGMWDSVRRGVLPGCPPVGYLNSYIDGKSVIITDSKLAPLVREAFVLASKKSSLRNILAELTPKGLVSRNGKPMGPSALMGILKNPFNTGRIRYHGHSSPGKHEAIVVDDLFMDAVLSLRSKREP